MPKDSVVIKNVSVSPDRLPNDGTGSARVSAVVFTANEGARIRRVVLDLSSLKDGAEKAMAFHTDQGLRKSGEGQYTCEAEVALLSEPGVYDLPIRVEDSEGATGQAFARLSIVYQRPAYAGGILAPANLSALERAGGAAHVPGNSIKALVSGEEAFLQRITLVRSARRQINLETYVLSSEGRCGQLVEAIEEKAAQGVEVNIILNGSSQLGTYPMTVLRLGLSKVGRELSELAREVEEARESKKGLVEIIRGVMESPGLGLRGINLILADDDAMLGEPEAHKPRRSGKWLQKMSRDQKALDKERKKRPSDWAPFFRGPAGLPSLPLLSYAVHEKIMVVDGETAIVGGRNLEDRYFDNWIDLEALVSGPLVQAIQTGFIRTWNSFAKNLKREQLALAPAPAQPEAGSVAAAFVQSRPWLNKYNTLELLATAFQMARDRILIATQYIVLPDSLLRDTILDAVSRGVAVTILTNSHATISDVGIAAGYYISLNYFETLLHAGVRLFEMKGPDREGDPVPYLHAKEFLVDGEWAAIGSFNLSTRSCFIESENLLSIPDPAFVREREAEFQNLVSHHAIPITREYFRAQKEKFKTMTQMAKYLELLY